MSGRVAKDRLWLGFLILAQALALAACASTPSNRVLPPDEQYQRAQEAYGRGEYRDAVSAFQTFSFNYPQDPRVVDARWLTAESYFAIEDWATAAQEYLNFQRDFMREPRAAEALFKAGRSYQEMSLRPELDQRDTERAINIYERVMNEYPQSEYFDQAQQRRTQLRDKLAEKTYLNAEFYFDNEDFKAAEIYLTDLIGRYTDSDWLPAGYALLARTFCAEGLPDRAADAYRALRDSYPDSAAADQVGDELSSRCREKPSVEGTAGP